MNRTALIGAILITSLMFWAPLFFSAGRRKNLMFSGAGCAVLCGAVFMAGGAGFAAAAAVALLSILILLSAIGLAEFAASLRGLIAPEALFLLSGGVVYGGVFLSLLADAGGVRGIFLTFNIPLAVSSLGGVNILRDIWYDASPLSTLYILMPSFTASCIYFAAAGAVFFAAGRAVSLVLKKWKPETVLS